MHHAWVGILKAGTVAYADRPSGPKNRASYWVIHSDAYRHQGRRTPSSIWDFYYPPAGTPDRFQKPVQFSVCSGHRVSSGRSTRKTGAPRGMPESPGPLLRIPSALLKRTWPQVLQGGGADLFTEKIQGADVALQPAPDGGGRGCRCPVFVICPEGFCRCLMHWA